MYDEPYEEIALPTGPPARRLDGHVDSVDDYI